MMEEPFVHKIFIGEEQTISGKPNTTDPMKSAWTTSIYKAEVKDPIWIGKAGLLGDEGAALVHTKRRTEQAIFTYPIKHYTYWKDFYEDDSLDMGMVGENFSVLEMDEYSVCIGDIFQYGDLVLQVSQPKQPNWQMARKCGHIDLAVQMQNTGRTGWCFRVLQEGEMQAHVDIDLIERHHPEWTIAACNEVMHQYKDDLRLTEQLATCNLLSDNWKLLLKSRLRGKTPSERKRLYGPNKK